ncbi:MAG: hypothetical protein F4060_02440 [Holophagales bacterium]|nr:hypothetical protein [Holophagales bacterium]MYG30088.1 hypothetical protein [Holophagales bacterium]MYI78776.1 hypothetical protein [Holophagales bacterium]
MKLHRKGLAAIRRHAVAEWPRESVGVIDDLGRYRIVPNIAADPEAGFELPADLYLWDVAAIVHSHPNGAEFPSRTDMESQIAAGVLYGIVPVSKWFADGPCRGRWADPYGSVSNLIVGEPFFWPDTGRPYLGRPYRHGVTDCYTLLRDWYRRERGLELPAVAYDWRWDESDAELDLYTSWRRRLDWAEIDPAEAQPGDAVLFRMAGSEVANHAGVLLEGGLLLHHPSPKPYDPTCLSRRTPLGRLTRYVAEVVRPPEIVS